MPIPRDKFEMVKKIKSLVLKFLYDNNGLAFTESEILKGIGLGHTVDIYYNLYELSFSEYIESKEIDTKLYYIITAKGYKWGENTFKSKVKKE